MDIDRGLIKAILNDGMSAFHDAGLKLDMILDDQAGGAFEYIDKFYKTHGKVPDPITLRDNTGYSTDDLPQEPFKFWATEVQRRYIYNFLKSELQKPIQALSDKDSEKARDEIRSLALQLDKMQFDSAQRPELFFANQKEIFDDYHKSVLGVTGVPTPWTSMNYITKGWQPEDFIVVAARPGIGKTFFLLLIVKEVIDTHRVLIGSTEMSKTALKRRMAALATKKSYSRLRHGNFTSAEFEAFKNDLSKFEDNNNIWIMGDSFALSPESLENAIIEIKPDLVCVDGVYLMKMAKGFRQKSERISEILDAIKDIAKRRKVPIICTSQMNRSGGKGGKKDDDFSLERLAFSDNAGMVADYVFFLGRSDDDIMQKRLQIKIGKTRDSDYAKDITINWDFNAQEFSEVAGTNPLDNIKMSRFKSSTDQKQDDTPF